MGLGEGLREPDDTKNARAAGPRTRRKFIEWRAMARQNLADLQRIMTRLRGRNGCPWDKKQTHSTLVRHLKEESQEVVQAIRKKDPENLCEELGDLLHQIVFHAELAREKKRFTMADVVDGLCRKIIRRHPHVFGKKKLKTVDEVMVQWDEIKRREKLALAKRKRR